MDNSLWVKQCFQLTILYDTEQGSLHNVVTLLKSKNLNLYKIVNFGTRFGHLLYVMREYMNTEDNVFIICHEIVRFICEFCYPIAVRHIRLWL